MYSNVCYNQYAVFNWFHCVLVHLFIFHFYILQMNWDWFLLKRDCCYSFLDVLSLTFGFNLIIICKFQHKFLHKQSSAVFIHLFGFCCDSSALVLDDYQLSVLLLILEIVIVQFPLKYSSTVLHIILCKVPVLEWIGLTREPLQWCFLCSNAVVLFHCILYRSQFLHSQGHDVFGYDVHGQHAQVGGVFNGCVFMQLVL